MCIEKKNKKIQNKILNKYVSYSLDCMSIMGYDWQSVL